MRFLLPSSPLCAHLHRPGSEWLWWDVHDFYLVDSKYQWLKDHLSFRPLVANLKQLLLASVPLPSTRLRPPASRAVEGCWWESQGSGGSWGFVSWGGPAGTLDGSRARLSEGPVLCPPTPSLDLGAEEASSLALGPETGAGRGKTTTTHFLVSFLRQLWLQGNLKTQVP